MKRTLVRAGTARKAFLGVVLTLVFANYCYAQELTASFYTVSGLHRDGQWKITKGLCADGKTIFRDEGYTSACNSFKRGVQLRVTDLQSGRSVVVRNTDKTNRRFTGKRIDLSRQSFITLVGSEQDLKKGLLKVRVEYER